MFRKIAHRGASGNYTENTRLAFEKAIEARVDMIEIDCQLTADGHVVVFHDERLDRLARVKDAVRRLTLAELKKIEIGQRKKGQNGERILTLEEALDLIGERADLCLDIKQFPQSPQGIELKLLFTLSHYDCLDRAILSSFDYLRLHRVRELAPEARIGVICGVETVEDPLAAAKSLGAAALLAQKELVTRELLGRAWEEGFDVYIWTVNEFRDMEKFASLGVQGLISDFPERFWKLRWK